jgi:hypothetical protein
MSQIYLVHTSTSHFLNIHLNIILPSMPGSPKFFFPSGYPTNILHASFLSPIRAICPVRFILLDLFTWIISVEYRSLSSSLWSFSNPRHLVLLRHKYSPQHPILNHPQPTFLPQCGWPSFTPTHGKPSLDVMIILRWISRKWGVVDTSALWLCATAGCCNHVMKPQFQ